MKTTLDEIAATREQSRDNCDFDVVRVAKAFRNAAYRLDQGVTLTNREFWSLMHSVCDMDASFWTADPGSGIVLIRALIDRLRKTKWNVLLFSDEVFTEASKVQILEKASGHLARWGDFAASHGILRHKADMLAGCNRFEQACSGVMDTIKWLKELELLNLLQFGEYLEHAVAQHGAAKFRTEKIEYTERAVSEAARHDPLISDRFRASLYHSAGLIHLSFSEVRRGAELMKTAWTVIQTGTDYNTQLMIISSLLRLENYRGNIAGANSYYMIGARLIAEHRDGIFQVHRYSFRQNAAGYLYRVGCIRDADLMYRRIFEQDADVLRQSPIKYAKLLTSRALVYSRMGFGRRAERYHRKALDMFDQIGGENRHYAATCVHLSSNLLKRNRRPIFG